MQVAHFLEADEQPWAAALAAALFTPFSEATPAANPVLARWQMWKHLDELAPLGDAADAVLRAWRLPLREQLPLTPAKWQHAVIRSHVAEGWLKLDWSAVVACCNAMRGVRGVHSLALDLRPPP